MTDVELLLRPDRLGPVLAQATDDVDGPDAVHRRTVARTELRRERPYFG